jgi:glycosyltransferase involved in cell wall biosynthesis
VNRKGGVLFVASDYPPMPGGRAAYIDNLARGLVEQGYNATVLAVVQANRKDRLEFLEHYENWVTALPVVHDTRPTYWLGNTVASALEIVRCLSPAARCILARAPIFKASIRSVEKLEQALNRYTPAMVLFGHLDMRLYPFALHLIDKRLPYGIFFHGAEAPYVPTRVNEFLRRRTVISNARWLIANSRYTAALLKPWRVPPGRISILHPGLADEASRASCDCVPQRRTGAELKLVTLCRLVRGKAVDVVLRALQLLDAWGIPYHYVVAGDGSERQELEALADRLKVKRNVEFRGYIAGSEKWELLRESNVFVMAPREEVSGAESFGLAFIEAGAFGLPSIGSNVGGIPEAVIHGVTGILVAPESPKELADALRVLYRSPEMRLQMGRAAMERAQRDFAPGALAAQFQRQIATYGVQT